MEYPYLLTYLGEKPFGGQGSAPDPLGELTTLSQIP